MKKRIALFLILALMLWGCSTNDTPTTAPTTVPSTAPTTPNNSNPTTPNTPNNTNPTTSNATDPTVEPTLPETNELFSDRDMNTNVFADDDMLINFLANGAETSCRSVQISGGVVTITEKGIYGITGSTENGMIIIDVPKDDKVQLVLSGVSITSPTSAAIYVRQADKVFITTAQGTENYLANGGSFVAIDENDIDATIFSKDDLTLNGKGSLTVESPVAHGIVSKDELTITSGTYTVTTASHGLVGKDSLAIAGGSFTVASGKDGLRANNDDDAELGFLYIADGTFAISAEGDGISAGTTLQIEGGSYNILAGGGNVNGSQTSSDAWGNFGGGGGNTGGSGGGSSDANDDSTSMKGIKSGADMVISAGTFNIDSADDSLHSNASLSVTGGSFTMASGDDGIHAEDTLHISGGTISISKSYEGLEALHVLVTGGDITMTASDDGINAAGGVDESGAGGRDQGSGGSGGSNGTIKIQGGTIHFTASGDGMDANGSLEITGGYIVSTGPTQGDTSVLDYDASGTITGGTYIGTGGRGFGQSLSTGQTQGVLVLSVNSAQAGTKITVKDSDGNVILEHSPQLSFNYVVISSPDIVKGSTYTVTIGSSSQSAKAK